MLVTFSPFSFFFHVRFVCVCVLLLGEGGVRILFLFLLAS